MSRRYPLTYPPELGSGPRIGGKFVGPYSGTMAIWKGRPPTMSDQLSGEMEPASLCIQAPYTGDAPGQGVTIEFQGGNAWGGVTSRTFQIGQGISAEMQAGQFAHVSVRAVTPLIAGQDISFSWTFDPVNRSKLYQFRDYPAGDVGTVIPLPEGCEQIISENAGNVTFRNNLFPTTPTFGPISVAAGGSLDAFWPAFSFNAATKFIFVLRGI